MGSVLDREWRRFATGLSFAIFGATGLVLGGVVLPGVRVVVRDLARRRRVTRAIIAWAFRRFVGIMRGLGLLTHTLDGIRTLAPAPRLVLANHPSLIDTVFLLGFVRHSTCIVDETLFANPYTGPVLRAAGYIRNDAGPDVLPQCAAALAEGLSVIVFPEGTRTPRDGTIVLRRGAAQIALRTGCEIVPVSVTCIPRTLTKGEPWWRIPPHRPHFTLRAGAPIAVRDYPVADEPLPVTVRRLTAQLQDLFRTASPPHVVT